MLSFVDHVWQNYFLLKEPNDYKKKQVSALFPTGLIEHGDGVEFTFVPTLFMKDAHCKLLELYDKIKVEDTSVALCNEVFFTNKIEGANTTLAITQEIHDGVRDSADLCKSERMVLNGFRATKYLNLKPGPLDEDKLLKLWSIVVDDVCENEDIRGDKYRTGKVCIGSHVGLNPELIPEAMTNWIKFYNSKSLEEYPFIKAALLHFVFEYIHPFCDGNGRTGRFLMNNYLICKGFDKIKAVSFSHSIEKERLEYDVAFKHAENVYSDCTPFIEYMLRIMLDAFTDVTGIANKVFTQYAESYGLKNGDDLQNEILRLSKLYKTSDREELAKFVMADYL